MNGSDFNLRHLRAFVAVCDFGGISAAAQEVHVSQPALTQAISGLENRLEQRLFDRGPRGMFPTTAGTCLLLRIRRAMAHLRAMNGPSRRARLSPDYMNVVTTTQLRALISVAQHGNFSVAARANGLSQPSLNRAARDLEALCGVALFTRKAQGVALTPIAEELTRAAKLAFSELDQAIEELTELRGARAGQLRIGCLPLSLGTVLPVALNRLTETRPQVHATVLDAPFPDMLHALRNGDIDILIGALRDPPPATDVVQEALFEDRLCICCRPGHPLANSRPDKATLATYPWIVARRASPTREHFNRFFASHEGMQVAPLIESNAMVLVLRTLEGSDRLTMISRTQASAHIRAGALTELPVDLGDTPRLIGVATRQSWRPTETQTAFLTCLREAAQAYTQKEDRPASSE